MTITTKDCTEAINKESSVWRWTRIMHIKWKRQSKKNTSDGILRVFVNSVVPGIVVHVIEDANAIKSVQPYLLPEWMHYVYDLEYDEEIYDLYGNDHDSLTKAISLLPMKSNDFIFDICEDEDMAAAGFGSGITIMVSPKAYYDKHGCWYDQHFDASALFPSCIMSEDEMEGVWSVEDGVSLEEAKKAMIDAGFIYTPAADCYEED